MQQTGRYNCGSACLAMILGTTVQSVEENVIGRRVGSLVDPETGVPVGLTSFEMQCALWDWGVRHLYLNMTGEPDPDRPETNHWYARVHKRMPVIAGENRVCEHLDEGGPAILGVDSLRHEGGEHWIAARGRELMDPAGKPGDDKRYASMDDYSAERPLLIKEAILIENEWLRRMPGGDVE